MQAVFEKFKQEVEVLLNPIIDEAKKYYGDDEAAYFNWLQKAAFIKMHAPDIQIEELTPQTMARPLNRIIKAKI